MDPFVTYADVASSYNVQMLEKAFASASTFVGEKLVNFAAVIEPYTSSIAHEVTSFASAHPVLTSAVGTIVVLALALKIALIAFKCFDKCCKSNKKKQETQFTNMPIIIPINIQNKSNL